MPPHQPQPHGARPALPGGLRGGEVVFFTGQSSGAWPRYVHGGQCEVVGPSTPHDMFNASSGEKRRHLQFLRDTRVAVLFQEERAWVPCLVTELSRTAPPAPAGGEAARADGADGADGATGATGATGAAELINSQIPP